MKKTFLILLCGIMIISMDACNKAAGDGQPSESLSESESNVTAPDSGTQTPDDGTQTPDDGTQTPDDGTQTPGDTATDEKSIDIYIIAGQSNAAGFTRVKDEDAAYEYAPELVEGFSNVLCSGNARYDKDNCTIVVDHRQEWQPIKLGFGYLDVCIGPEAGMAKALSSYYNEDTGRYAGIIKMAHGGTRLTGNSTAGSNAFGNWTSPSYAKARGWNYSGATGGLYRELLAEVERQIGALKEYGGFTTVRLIGLYWMQGESDRESPQEYKTAFTYFADDIRRDLSSIMKEYTGTNNDCGASSLPIYIGSLSQTYNLNSARAATINEAFISMQRSLADTLTNCYFVDNTSYVICEPWNGSEVQAAVRANDMHHWGQADMLEIGSNVGSAMLSLKSNSDWAVLNGTTASSDASDNTDYTPFY